jgi:hypothetical protein
MVGGASACLSRDDGLELPDMFSLYAPNSQPSSRGRGLPVSYVIWATYAAHYITRATKDGKTWLEVKNDSFECYSRRRRNL